MGHESDPRSAAHLWPPLARFAAAEARLGSWAQAKGPAAAGCYEFLRFGMKQGWACLFCGLIFAMLIASYLFYPTDAALSRYDALTLGAVAIQVELLVLRMETWEEAKVIALYHVVGTVMEVFKTGVGSWVYPEASLLRLAVVPLFTGFMLVAAFIWLAENIGTFTRVWLYPKQAAAWSVVSGRKLGSWFLLTIVSYVLVTPVSRPRRVRRSAREAGGAGLGADGTAQLR